MATTKTTGTKSRGTKGAAKAAPSSSSTTVKTTSVAEVGETVQVSEPAKVAAPIKAVRREKPVFALTDSILVRNGFHGPLTIQLPKAGYAIRMQEFGDEDYIEVADLRTLRNSSPKYFKKNWILFDDPDIIEYLHLEEFYKHALSVDGINDLFVIPVDEAVAKICSLSDGQKKTVMYAALHKIETGEMDSLVQIKAFEQALGVQLTEPME